LELFNNWKDTLEFTIKYSYEHSVVPEEANLEAVNQFLLECRRLYW